MPKLVDKLKDAAGRFIYIGDAVHLIAPPFLNGHSGVITAFHLHDEVSVKVAVANNPGKFKIHRVPSNYLNRRYAENTNNQPVFKTQDSEPLADAIRKVSVAAEALRRSGLNQHAIIILLSAHSKISQRDCKKLLESLSQLEKTYCRVNSPVSSVIRSRK